MKFILSVVFALLAACASNPSARAPASTETMAFKHKSYVAPDELRDHDVRTLGEALVTRIHRECDMPRTGTPDSDGITKDSEIVMMVRSWSLANLQRFGMPNQHISHTTSGTASPKFRYNAEQELAMMRIPYSAKGRELLPRYATFNIKRDDFGHYGVPYYYGDMIFVLKDDVKRRTTWTYTDSLGVPFGKRGDPYYPPRTFRFDRVPSDTTPCEYYCETQTWGDLNLTDVDHILVPSGTSISDEVKNLGLPIFFWENNEEAQGQSINFKISGTAFAGGTNTTTPPSELNLAALQREVADPATNPIVASILNGRGYGLLSVDELLARLAKTTAVTPDDFDSYDPYTPGNSKLSEREFLVAELASRPKTAAIFTKLNELTDDPDEFVRYQAYYGLSESSKSDFKKAVLKCLGDSAKTVLFGCLDFADDFADDSDIKGAIDHLQNSDKFDMYMLDEMKRMKAPHLCEKNP